MKEIRAAARERMKGHCRVCPVCDGKACSGEVPGMGGLGTGASFRNNREALNACKLNMTALHVPVPETEESDGRHRSRLIRVRLNPERRPFISESWKRVFRHPDNRFIAPARVPDILREEDSAPADRHILHAHLLHRVLQVGKEHLIERLRIRGRRERDLVSVVKGENPRSIETRKVHAAIYPERPFRYIDPIVGFERIEKRGGHIPGAIGDGSFDGVDVTPRRRFGAGVGARHDPGGTGEQHSAADHFFLSSVKNGEPSL